MSALTDEQVAILERVRDLYQRGAISKAQAEHMLQRAGIPA